MVSVAERTHEALGPILEEFTAATGIAVALEASPASGSDQVAQLAPAFAAGSSPFDVVMMSDEATPGFARAGWLRSLDGVVDAETLESDFPQGLRDYMDTWSSVDGTLYRLPTGWSIHYYWQRADLLGESGIEAPTTWDDLLALSSEASGPDLFAFADASARPGLAGVYATYLCMQSGANPFDMDDQVGDAFQFARSLLDAGGYPEAALNWDYAQTRAAYMEDRLLTMGDWGAFLDVAQENSAWYDEEKTTLALPPEGPAGSATWGGAWGWTVPEFAEHGDEAMEFVTWVSSPEGAAKLAAVSGAFVSDRRSVLDALGDDDRQIVALRTYSDAGVIRGRPFHEDYNAAAAVVDEVFSGMLAGQYDVSEALERGREGIGAIG